VVGLLRANSLIPANVPIHGMMFDQTSGHLKLLVEGYTPAGRVSEPPIDAVRVP
jgi:hypothetical protein